MDDVQLQVDEDEVCGPKIGLWLKLKLLCGTPRRFILNTFRPGYVRKSLALRSGACKRCGTCCKLVWKCGFLEENNGCPSCKLYDVYRHANCSNFPIDHRDIADRDCVNPDEPCGFTWAPKGQEDKQTRG